MRFGIVVFPGTWSDTDCFYALHNVLGFDVSYVWHEETDISSYDCIILPGGFSYGDYLRTGAIAKLSPIIPSLHKFILEGKIVIGICNGFQILCEAGFLPGVLLRNESLEYRCVSTQLKVERTDTIFSNHCLTNTTLNIPISHGEGNYYTDSETLKFIESNGQVIFRYSDINGNISHESNPNGSLNNIAGITNHAGNVLGMMPHPERCCENILGSTDGSLIFESIVKAVEQGLNGYR
ncbi:MAG TPA: phosphoribosylformylglycinamidine synthase I [Dehalococcoidia bacterium]|nr:phosphoribosylformylglycinamidine synthase I [Dehalococcoidia bacterium]